MSTWRAIDLNEGVFFFEGGTDVSLLTRLRKRPTITSYATCSAGVLCTLPLFEQQGLLALIIARPEKEPLSFTPSTCRRLLRVF